MIVIGIERLCFPDSKEPEKMVNGVQVYCGYPIDPEKGSGLAYSKKGYERIYISEWLLKHRLNGVVPDVGDEVQPSYNRDGKLQDLYIRKPTK